MSVRLTELKYNLQMAQMDINMCFRHSKRIKNLLELKKSEILKDIEYEIEHLRIERKNKLNRIINDN